MKLSFNWFNLILLFPCFYFFYWIDNTDRDSKIFPIFYYFYWIYFPIFALLGIFMAVVLIFFITILLKNWTDIRSWGIWFLFILLVISINRLIYSCFKKMFRLRRELGESNGGRH